MAGPPRLRPQDHADFEAVLDVALNTGDVRSALRADPTGRASVRLRAQALEAAEEITAAAVDAYAAYLATRDSPRPDPVHPTGGGTVLPALMVLTPLVAATSAAVLLLLGYVLQVADASGSFPASLVTAGWVLALIAVVSTLVTLIALLRKALHQRGGRPSADRLEAGPAGLAPGAARSRGAALLARMREPGPTPRLRDHRTPGPRVDRTRMFGLSELAVVLIVVIAVLAAKKLPDLARSAGKIGSHPQGRGQSHEGRTGAEGAPCDPRGDPYPQPRAGRVRSDHHDALERANPPPRRRLPDPGRIGSGRPWGTEPTAGRGPYGTTAKTPARIGEHETVVE